MHWSWLSAALLVLLAVGGLACAGKSDLSDEDVARIAERLASEPAAEDEDDLALLDQLGDEDWDAIGEAVARATCEANKDPAFCYCGMDWIKKHVGWARFVRGTADDYTRWAALAIRDGCWPTR